MGKINDKKMSILQKFTYDSKLSDLDVYSRQYLSSILFNKYRDNTNLEKSEPYSVIFGDFNKLGRINKLFGDEAGDSAIISAMTLIKEQLPENCKISRIGGDEFLFIIENSTQDEITHYIEKIYSVLDSDENKTFTNPSNKEENLKLTIEMAAIDSTHTSGINEMYQTAEKIVSNKKKKYGQE
ncbi:MAG: GGDEF domain-containing protein [Clostridia bacterium]|nr:GGDEF domain-containing protein [Clostridia bacterium]